MSLSLESETRNSVFDERKGKVIWWFNHYAVPPDLPGGTRHYEIARAIASRGYTSYIFASNYSHFSFQRIRDEGLEKVEKGVHFYWIKTIRYPRTSNLMRALNMFSYYLRVKAQAMRALKEKLIPTPDIIVGSTVHPLAALAAEQLSRKLRVPFVYEIRDLWPQALVESGKVTPSSPSYTLLDSLNRRLLRASQLIIVLSPETGDLISQEMGISPSKLLLLPNYIDYDEVQRALERLSLPDEVRKLISSGEEKFFLCYAGSLSYLHASDVLLEVAKRLPNGIELVLIGDGTMRDKVEVSIRERKITNVKVLGPYPRKLVWRILREFHALIVLDRNQAWGSSNKLADYLIAERPIIFVTASQQNFIEGMGLRANLDPDDITGKVNYLLSNYHTILRRVKELAPKLRKRLDLKANVEELLRRFEELLSVRGRSSMDLRSR